MSLFEQASLCITPNGTKASKLYAIKPTDGSGDLTVTRATTATRVNASGLISSVASNVPRLDYTNSSCPSILVEPQRTNLVTYSEQFDNISWIKLNVSITPNTAVSPDGNTNADAVIPNTTSGLHALRSNNFNQSSTTSHSWFVKANGYSKIAVRESDLSIGNYASFDLSNGTLISTSQSGIIEDYGNGWYRCTLVDTTTGAGAQTSIFVLPDSYTTGNPLINWSGDGVKGVFAYGATAEVGPYPTSYIPTVASAVTRNADIISKTGISSLIGQTEGTLFCEVLTSSIETADYHTFVLVYGNGANRVAIGKEQGTSNIFYYVNANGSVTFQIISEPLGRYKMALAYKSGSSCLYINGVSVFTSTNALSFSTALTDFYINQRPGGYEIGKLDLYSSALFKTRLSNTELATLTTI
jgi:hypothetical protein